MEKLKQIVHSGKEKDDEVLYGSNRTSGPVHAGDTMAGHHVDPLSGNVNKPLPHTPASSTAAPGLTGSTLGHLPDRTIDSPIGSHHHDHVGVGEVRHHYHNEHVLHPKNPPPLEDPRIADVITFDHTPVETLKAAIEKPVPLPIPATAVPVAGSPVTAPTAGPHSTHIANKLDPHVGSNNNGSSPLGGHVPGTHSYDPIHSTGTAGAGYGSPTTSSGPHSTNLANQLDPRVATAATGAAGYGAGRPYNEPGQTSGLTASPTTGPYSSTTGVSSSADPYSSTTGVPSSAGPYSGTTGGVDPYHGRETERTPDYHTTERDRHYTDEKYRDHHTDKHYQHEEKHESGGILGKLLHRNKDSHPDEVGNNQHPYSSTSTTTGVGQDTYDNNANDYHDRNRLHKDPPLDQSGLPTSGQTTTYDNDHHERHRLHKDPPKELLEQRGIPTGPNSDEYRTEPHTGLPMNVGKYGTTGVGGTDQGPMPGYHTH